MIKTPGKINNNISKLAKALSIKEAPVFIEIKSDKEAKIKDCVNNVYRKIWKSAGEMVLGWKIWEHPFMIEAEFHTIWRSPAGELIDITPIPTKDINTLFLIDRNLNYEGKQIDNFRFNYSDNRLVDDFIELNKAKFRIENKGERQNQIGEIQLLGKEAEIWQAINQMIIQINAMLMKGSSLSSPCFCQSNVKYKHCHGKGLIQTLKRI